MQTTPSNVAAEMSFQAIVKPYPAATIAAGAAKAIGQSLAKLGASAAFLVTDQGVTGAGITAQLEGYITEAGIECVVFDQVEANPTMSIIQAGIKILREDMPEGTVIVSLGGGSSMDAAKAMAIIAPDGGDDVGAYCMQPELAAGSEFIDPASMVPAKMATAPAIPIIAIPTTSGTASETNGGAVITDDTKEMHRKVIFSSPGAAAVETILDPELTLKLPACTLETLPDPAAPICPRSR